MTSREYEQALDDLDLELHRIQLGVDLMEDQAHEAHGGATRSGQILFLIDATRDRIALAKAMVAKLYAGKAEKIG